VVLFTVSSITANNNTNSIISIARQWDEVKDLGRINSPEIGKMSFIQRFNKILI
jgi:hypothetical protein